MRHAKLFSVNCWAHRWAHRVKGGDVPKKAAEMSALQVARLKEEGDHHVGGVDGLLLRIKGNSRVWVLRVRVDGRRPNIGLGSFPAVGLAQARESARQKVEQIRLGNREGLTVRQVKARAAAERAKVMTFKEAAKAMILSMKPGWKNPKHADQWTSTLETYAYPSIGSLPVPEIATAHLLEILNPIWYTKSETASRVRGRVEAVIDYYAAINHTQIPNPARWKGHLDKLLPKKSKVHKVEHHKAVPWKEAKAAGDIIRARRGIAAKALQAVILSACRYGEVTGMRKGEILWDERLWIVGAERMKADRDHYVPLSDQMVTLLKSVGADVGDPGDLVFGSSQKDRAGMELTDSALVQVMKKNGIDATTHGWRSTFRDWAGETTNYPNELCELALAHTIANKAEAAYRRGDMLEKRRPLMQDWADYVLPKEKAQQGA